MDLTKFIYEGKNGNEHAQLMTLHVIIVLLYKYTETQSDDHCIMYISVTKKYNYKIMVVDRGGVSTFFPKTYNKMFSRFE